MQKRPPGQRTRDEAARHQDGVLRKVPSDELPPRGPRAHSEVVPRVQSRSSSPLAWVDKPPRLSYSTLDTPTSPHDVPPSRTSARLSTLAVSYRTLDAPI